MATFIIIAAAFMHALALLFAGVMATADAKRDSTTTKGAMIFAILTAAIGAGLMFAAGLTVGRA